MKQVKKSKLEYRMYNLVMYNISPIQQGIQSLHSVVEYGILHGKTYEWQKWSRKDKTIIVLNGGTSSTMLNHSKMLEDNKINFSFFLEPDLNNSMSAISFIIDERVFNKEKYPEPDWSKNKAYGNAWIERELEKWKKEIGGEQNFFLRNWLKNFRLA